MKRLIYVAAFTFLVAVIVDAEAQILGGASGQLRQVRAEVAPFIGSSGVYPGTDIRVALEVRLPEGFHVQSDAPFDERLIPTVLTVDTPEGVSVTEIIYPMASTLRQKGAEELLAIFDHEFAVGLEMFVGARIPVGRLEIPASLHYQTCDDELCYPPDTVTANFTLNVVPTSMAVTDLNADVLEQIRFGQGRAPEPVSADGHAQTPNATEAAVAGGMGQLDDFVMLGSAGGYLDVKDFLAFISNAENGVEDPGLFDGRGPLVITAVVLLGGLALNLTPCVLPMIPINLAIIGAGAQAGSRRKGFLLGSAYGGALALVYGLLGLIVILTTGTFGTINASPWFNLGIALLFVVLGLAMFDVLRIDFSRWSSRFRPKPGSRGNFALAFSMGTVAALLAGACVAPVVIQVVLFSSNLYATGIPVALALPFLLGIGMAAPWPIVGAGMAALPKPGKWMVHVKHAFGIIIVATAGYYGYLAYGIFENRSVDAGSVTSSVLEKLEDGWHADLASGLAAAQREQKSVLIDMWATWCKNCLTMDKTTLSDSDVVAALDGYVKIKFQAEDPGVEPAKSLMQRFDVVGLPAYIILSEAG